jgi:cytochrome c oxidase cbb3-type subunit III
MNRSWATFGQTVRDFFAASWFSAILAFLCAGCDGSGQPKAPDRPVPADQVVDFNALYSQNCAGCHGADGKLGPAPPLNDAAFLAIVPDGEIMKLVTEGRAGTPMPGFSQKKGGSLTDEQVKVLAMGLKSRWKSSKPPLANLPGYIAEKTATSADKKHGLEVFSRACASCHGADGEGIDKKAGAIHDPDFLALISDQTLRRYVITGRPDLGMPNFAEKTRRSANFQPLSSRDIDDVVALLAHWRQTESVAAVGDKSSSDKKNP